MSPTHFVKLADHTIGSGLPCLIIAEVAQGHDGSLGMAHAFIDAAAAAGADAIKFQTHLASAESTLDEPFRVSFSQQDETRFDYWQRMEFTREQWQGLAKHATEKGLCFLSSPFSVEAVYLLQRLGVPAWKVGSGEVRSDNLLTAMLATKKPILLSTGMSPWGEIDQVVNRLHGEQVPLAVMQCTSRYPTPLEQVGLNVLDELRHRYRCPVGLSDHSGTPFPALAAMAQGCNVLELHVTFDRRMFGPDVPASITFEQLALINQARESFFCMAQNPVDKDRMAVELADMRVTFGKSLALVTAQPIGTVLTPELLTLKKPATGIPATRINQVIGKRLKRTVANHLLSWDDLEI